MSIPSHLSTYLGQCGARYEICLHDHSRTSAQTARGAHVPPRQAGCLLAVIPADKTVMIGELGRMLHGHFCKPATTH